MNNISNTNATNNLNHNLNHKTSHITPYIPNLVGNVKIDNNGDALINVGNNQWEKLAITNETDMLRMEINQLQKKLDAVTEVVMLLSSKLNLQDYENETFQEMRNEHVDRLMGNIPDKNEF